MAHQKKEVKIIQLNQSTPKSALEFLFENLNQIDKDLEELLKKNTLMNLKTNFGKEKRPHNFN